MNKKLILLALAFTMFFACDDTIKIKTEKQERLNTVSVSGTGDVYAQPDIATMNIYFSHTAKTTKEAKIVVENAVKKVIALLKDNQIEDKNIKTISLNFDTEHTYRKGNYVKIGQRAQQTIVVTVDNIIKDPERFPLLIDKIIEIDGNIEVRDIGFDIENKGELFKQSRELAYQKAFEKAEQYAQLSGHSIGKAIEITERTSEDISIANNSLGYRNVEGVFASLSDKSFSVPTGERKVSSMVNVTFLLKNYNKHSHRTGEGGFKITE